VLSKKELYMKKLSNRILLFALTFLITPQLYFTAYKDKSLTVFIMLLLIVFLFNIRTVAVTDIRRKGVLFYFLFLLAVIASFSYSFDKIDAFKNVFFLSLGIPVYYVYREVHIPRNTILKIFLLSSTPLLYCIIATYLSFEYKMDVMHSQFIKLFIEPDSLTALFKRTGGNINVYYKSGGFFINANIASLYLCFHIAIAFILTLTEKNKLVYLLYLLLAISSLICTGSMAGMITFLVTMIVIYTMYTLKRAKHQSIIVYACLLVLFLVSTLYLFNKFNSAFEVRDKAIHVHGRMPIWKASLRVIKENWLLGIGLDASSWSSKYNVFAVKYNAPLNQPTHNTFLNIWANCGITALLLFMLFILKSVMNAAKDFRNSNDPFSLLVVSFFICVFLLGITESIVLVDVRIVSAFFMIIGLGDRYDGIKST